ncbi:MAG: porin [Gammaproteobacteria bacterium]|nr:porin [Gammaproteobacteria bacterium]MDH5800810.1 porin [Gammaproteobacteria bacterium]
MKRSLIALAVSSAVIAPAAMAGDVTVYGRAQVEVSSISYQNAATGTDGVQLQDVGHGRLGFKASEDLGDGLTGMAVLEFKTNTADGAAVSLSDRETMVGLKGSFGQVELGNLKQAYKYAGGVKYDPFVASSLEARNNGGMVHKATNFSAGGQASFHSSAIGYRGKFGPVAVALTYGAEEGDGSMTAAAVFNAPAFEALVALADSGDSAGAGNSYSATKIGGQFRMAGGAHKISAQYEMGSIETGGATTDPTTLFVGYQGKFGKNLFVAQIGAHDNDAATNSGTSYMAVGAIHTFSKTTRVFGGYRNTDADTETRESVVSIGLRKDF